MKTYLIIIDSWGRYWWCKSMYLGVSPNEKQALEDIKKLSEYEVLDNITTGIYEVDADIESSKLIFRQWQEQ